MKYIAKRVYNNNVVLSENKRGEEVIFVGKGLAYGLSKGDTIDLEKAEKTFELSRESNQKFIDLIKDVSPEDILLCERVITYIKEQSNKEIDDSIYVTLTDHIINMIDRIRMGIDFDSAILLNIKSLYKQEYYIALQVVKILRKELNMKIDDSEASFITLHIVNAEMSSNMMQMYEVTTIMEGILGIVRNEFNITENNSDSYDRFITHCRFFVQRVVNREYLDKDPSTYEQMFKVMLDLYKKQYSCVHKIADYIEKKYNYLVEDDERMYLLIHLVKLTS
ncbi:PRD domain-containing protein [Faecalicoccus pleomorphus]|uniref:PRD domain-containing protein n=1 Tax=Faecalicoccus pleomorphus TaxID=1323 RepID=UPI0022E5C6E3|nr:PRD domain-containing protein [Faecalicoccus pleomorphus]